MLSVLMKLPLLSLTARLAPDLLGRGEKKMATERKVSRVSSRTFNGRLTHTLIWVLLIRYCSG